MDADQRVTGWNPAASQLFGYSPQEAIGHLIDDLVLNEDLREEGRDVTHEALEKGRADRITRRVAKDGKLVDVQMMLVSLRVDREHRGYYAIYHDITELQRARERAETLLAVTQVLGKTLSLDDTIEAILGELQRVVPYDSCSIQVIQGNRRVIVGGRGFDDLGALLGVGFDLDDESDPGAQVVRSKRPTGLRRRVERAGFYERAAGRTHSRLDLRADGHRRPRRRHPQRRQVRTGFLQRGAGGARDGIRRPGRDGDRECSAARNRACRPRAGRDAARGGRVARQHAGRARGLRSDPDGAAQGRALPNCQRPAARGQRDGDRRRAWLSEPRRIARTTLRLAGTRRSCPRNGGDARAGHRPGRVDAVRALPGGGPWRGPGQGMDGRPVARRRSPDRDADARLVRVRLLHRRARGNGRGICGVRCDGDRQGAIPQRAPARPPGG